MKLSEELHEMAGDYTSISGSWLEGCASEAEKLEAQVIALHKYRVKYSNVKKEVTSLHKKINKMKCCGNCKELNNLEMRE